MNNYDDMCFVIREFLLKITDMIYIDYILKCPYNPQLNQINLQEIKLLSLKQLLEDNSLLYDDDKFNKKRNIKATLMDVKTHNISLLLPLNTSKNKDNSVLQIKKEASQINIATVDELAGKNDFEPRSGQKRTKKFKRIQNVSSGNKDKNNLTDNEKSENYKNQYKTYHYKYNEGDNSEDNDDDENSRNNTHKMDHIYLNEDSFNININNNNINHNTKNPNANILGKNYNDLNANTQRNSNNNISNNANDSEIIKRFKEKTVSPSTAATDKSNYLNQGNINSSKRTVGERDAEIGRNLKDLK